MAAKVRLWLGIDSNSIETAQIIPVRTVEIAPVQIKFNTKSIAFPINIDIKSTAFIINHIHINIIMNHIQFNTNNYQHPMKCNTNQYNLGGFLII